MTISCCSTKTHPVSTVTNSFKRKFYSMLISYFTVLHDKIVTELTNFSNLKQYPKYDKAQNSYPKLHTDLFAITSIYMSTVQSHNI